MKLLKFAILLSAACLSGCFEGIDPEPPVTTACSQQTAGVNWQALLEENCDTLSDYNLFESPDNPTISLANSGINYALSTPLFSDYTSKYRLVYMPEGTAATYSQNETFGFPVGTVIVKTFTLPFDTAVRGLSNETLIETRLMIHRSTGWIGLPYVWNDEKSDATLAVAGANLDVSMIHDGQQTDFKYLVPDMAKCKQCHSINNGEAASISPIGPKARFLNSDYPYATGVNNQIDYWQSLGVLDAVPENKQTIDKAPDFDDLNGVDLSTLSDSIIEDHAKSYLDINCAHCHRPEGGASNTGLHLEYWRPLLSNENKHGLCKRPVAFGGGNLSFDIVPGDPDNSIMVYRMVTTKSGDKMPEIARNLTHSEGVNIVSEWVSRLGNTHGPCVN